MPAWFLEKSELRYQTARIRAMELMDVPGLDASLRQEALKGIERISHWPGQRRPLLKALLELAGQPDAKPLKIIEVGAGSGHLARWISMELARRGVDATVLATDLYPEAGVEKLDCLDEALPEADIYYSSLLLHHLQDDEVTRMLKAQYSKARLGVVHFDLQRNFFHFHLAKLATRVGGFHEINKTDALLSIQQGYTRAELMALAQGLPVELKWSFPFRWLMTWKR